MYTFQKIIMGLLLMQIAHLRSAKREESTDVQRNGTFNLNFRNQKGTEKLIIDEGRINSRKFMTEKNFKSLRRLKFNMNIINNLPDKIGKFEKLQELEFNANHVGPLPDTIGNLKNLQVLRFNANHVSPLPDTIGNLKNLRVLRLNANHTGALPENIGELENLQELDFNVNSMEGLLPDTIGNLKNLRVLKLNANRMGPLPSSAGDLENLQELVVGESIITSLPGSIGKLKRLRRLVIKCKELRLLPIAIKDLSDSLLELDLRGCKVLLEQGDGKTTVGRDELKKAFKDRVIFSKDDQSETGWVYVSGSNNRVFTS